MIDRCFNDTDGVMRIEFGIDDGTVRLGKDIEAGKCLTFDAHAIYEVTETFRNASTGVVYVPDQTTAICEGKYLVHDVLAHEKVVYDPAEREAVLVLHRDEWPLCGNDLRQSVIDYISDDRYKKIARTHLQRVYCQPNTYANELELRLEDGGSQFPFALVGHRHHLVKHDILDSFCDASFIEKGGVIIDHNEDEVKYRGVFDAEAYVSGDGYDG